MKHSLVKGCSYRNNCSIQLYDTDLVYRLMKNYSYRNDWSIQLYDNDLGHSFIKKRLGVYMFLFPLSCCGIPDLALRILKMLILNVRISEWVHTLYFPESQGTPCSKQARYLRFKWLHRDLKPQPISLAKWLSVRLRLSNIWS